MSRNTLWQIAFGDYDFALDRRALTYSLTETKNGIVWADNLSVGWLELENRETGERTRHTFAEMKLVSLSEKSGQQGKRILLGLDCLGIPVDLYFICSQKEIQLTVEASRDTRTHNVQEICLLPSLVSVPDDGLSYLVIPRYEGMISFASDVSPQERTLQVWDARKGVTMPFIGAVKNRTFNEPVSALALITDSAYGVFHLSRHDDGTASLDTHYSRDPERRRLDIRLVVLPEQNHVGVARAYRNKIIIDRNHVTLRQKMRERPEVGKLLGATFFFDQQPPDFYSEAFATVRYNRENAEDAVYLSEFNHGLSPEKDNEATRWDSIESQTKEIEETHDGIAVGGACTGDWSAIAYDFWGGMVTGLNGGRNRATVPLYSTVYHDSVIAFNNIDSSSKRRHFLRSILSLSLPAVTTPFQGREVLTGDLHRDISVLGPLHRLSFAAFLSEHRFLTPDFKVEEARYTNGAYILINQSETGSYENERVTLPPLGFYVEHPQMVAHDALRVGEEAFPTRAYRIARSRDGKSIIESADILRQEFSV